MPEYIEREALLRHKTLIPGFIGEYVLVERIKEAPAADVEPVVRCKDCKHHHWEQEPCHGRTEHLCDLLKMEVWKDFFCLYGKRKEGGE